MQPHARARRLGALTALVAAGAIVLPATASAAVTGAVSGTTATLTGDDAPDVIVIGEAGGFLTHSDLGAAFAGATDFDSTVAGDQTLPDDGTATVNVAAGGGNDAVTVTTDSLAAGATLDGGGGDDLITGNAGAQNLRGGDDDDRLVGATGGDDAEGGAGNDTLVWNNGDGSDVMDGDAGADEIEVNGAATVGDVFTINPGAGAGRIAFARTNLVPFALDVGSSERMAVNGLGGDDAITGAAGLAPLALLALNGGVGLDTITGGDGADLIVGGDDADALAGGGGDDRIVGDRGGDTMNGQAGDDTLVWNNGDGSDRMEGEAGLDRVEVNGAAGAGDAFTVAPNGARAKFDRTNLVPFALEIGTSEALDVRGAGGDDAFGVAAGAAALIAVTADGGAGNDTLTGAEGNETLAGGSGDDTLTGGGGSDVVDGQDGNDRLLVLDGTGDLARGGAGTDSAVADQAGVDTVVDVESVDRTATPPVADTKGTAATIRTTRASIRLRGNRGSTRIRVACPAAEAGGCRGTLTLTGTVRIGGRRITAVLGTARFDLAAGRSRTLTVRLPTRVRRLTAGRTLRVRAQTITRDSAGNLAQATRTVRLTLPRR